VLAIVFNRAGGMEVSVAVAGACPAQRATCLQPSAFRDASGARGISCFLSFITLKVVIKTLQLPAAARRAAAAGEELRWLPCLHGTGTRGSPLPAADVREAEDF